MTGRFIVFEGPDASGKTTQAIRVADRLGAVFTANRVGRASATTFGICCSIPSSTRCRCEPRPCCTRQVGLSTSTR